MGECMRRLAAEREMRMHVGLLCMRLNLHTPNRMLSAGMTMDGGLCKPKCHKWVQLGGARRSKYATTCLEGGNGLHRRGCMRGAP